MRTAEGQLNKNGVFNLLTRGQFSLRHDKLKPLVSNPFVERPGKVSASVAACGGSKFVVPGHMLYIGKSGSIAIVCWFLALGSLKT